MITSIWGDSIAFGVGDKEALGWPGRIRRAYAVDDDRHVYNFAVCGETSSDLLKRFEIECTAIEPDRVVFAIGINDARKLDGNESAVSLEDFKQNIERLITLAEKCADDIVLIGITSVGGEFRTSHGSIFSDSDSLRYNEALRQIAEQRGTTFINVFDVLDTSKDISDGVHPNTQGYQKLFEAISSQLNII